VITFWDVIEHIDFPVERLIRTYELLKPGGIALITSDNYNSLISKLARMLYFISIGTFQYPIRRFFTPYNRTYFTEKAMNKLLNKIGFEIVHFHKMQYPIDKLKLNKCEKIIINMLYKLENIFNLQSQFTFIVRKRPTPL
jgi:2-polyprenyl-6-hydroxyphenyl methylase/3-demethylubiquinone-9 3-methyltransferase